MIPYRDETVQSIAQIWANKYLMSRRPLPVPTGDIEIREANAVLDAERALLELAKSGAAKILRDAAPDAIQRPPTDIEVRDMAAAIAAEVVSASEAQARVDRTLLTLLQR
jgi:hypothetical protein